jgi:hypothetical protein
VFCFPSLRFFFSFPTLCDVFIDCIAFIPFCVSFFTPILSCHLLFCFFLTQTTYQPPHHSSFTVPYSNYA